MSLATGAADLVLLRPEKFSDTLEDTWEVLDVAAAVVDDVADGAGLLLVPSVGGPAGTALATEVDVVACARDDVGEDVCGSPGLV